MVTPALVILNKAATLNRVVTQAAIQEVILNREATQAPVTPAEAIQVLVILNKVDILALIPEPDTPNKVVIPEV